MGGRILTTREAADAVFVPVSTLRTWVERGLVAPLGRSDGEGLFAEDDVVAVERATRRRPRLDRLVGMARRDLADGW
jgi:DNA-binding transcriptional MerR regulator